MIQLGNHSGPRIGIGSFAYRYAVGFADFKPEKPMTVLDFLTEAHQLGFAGVQLCENLGYAKLKRADFLAIKEKARQLGLFIELGMRDLTLENANYHLDLAEVVGSSFLRIVLGNNQPAPEAEPDQLVAKAISVLQAILPRCRQLDVTIGIENHFDLSTDNLVKIVSAVNDDRVGMIFDTTNCLGFVERPEEVLEKIKPYLLSIHLKDYNIRKVEAGYLITGTALGEGWLDTRGILNQALQANPDLSIIIELTVRRQEGQSINETLHYEREAIKRSLDFLRKALNQ